ncbi:hypothetical protein EGW08_016220 [Elysia chlorotica]|uniref:C-type lectin domain-containing protein n=1 Tax=Elysia chlorotica TaxID=188477 RepID=A0A3S1B6B4_ELYCH|nr:hypothetical protein EGW08_016220 [Elysia chlorotica]
MLQSMAGADVWLGMTDIETEGTWLWEDGDELDYSNWANGEPNNWGPGEDCAVLKSRGGWNDLPCSGYARSIICKSVLSALDTCLDFSDKCPELFQLKPSMCVDFPEFAEEQCRYTCGLCLADDTPKCSVGELGPDVNSTETRTQLPRGAALVTVCDSDTPVRIAGDAVRGCDHTGSLTGSPLRCAEGCPSGWTFLEDELACYKYFDTRETNAAAAAECSSYGAILATAKTSTENNLLKGLSATQSWIGGSDSNSENDFIWSDGSPITWSNWRNGEPNNWGSGEDCVVLRSGGDWDDRSCNYRYTYLCKMVHPADYSQSDPCNSYSSNSDPCNSDPYNSDPCNSNSIDSSNAYSYAYKRNDNRCVRKMRMVIWSWLPSESGSV